MSDEIIIVFERSLFLNCRFKKKKKLNNKNINKEIQRLFFIKLCLNQNYRMKQILHFRRYTTSYIIFTQNCKFWNKINLFIIPAKQQSFNICVTQSILFKEIVSTEKYLWLILQKTWKLLLRERCISLKFSNNV